MVPSTITSPIAIVRPSTYAPAVAGDLAAPGTSPVAGALAVVPEVGDRLLSMRDASRVAGGLHRNTLRRLWSQTDDQGRPRFPKPVEMSPGRYGFLASELRAWIAARPRVA